MLAVGYLGFKYVEAYVEQKGRNDALQKPVPLLPEPVKKPEIPVNPSQNPETATVRKPPSDILEEVQVKFEKGNVESVPTSMELNAPGWNGVVLSKPERNANGEWVVTLGEKGTDVKFNVTSHRDLSKFKKMEPVAVTGVVTQIEKNGTFQIMNAELKLDGGQ